MDLLKIRISVMGGGRFLTLEKFPSRFKRQDIRHSHRRINHGCADPKADWGRERGESIKLS